MAVMIGTGGTATCRVTCTGVVRHGWASQPAGGLGGSGGCGAGSAAGDTDAPGDDGNGVPRADGDADRDADGDADGPGADP
jgi:hypothetical protein